MNKWLELILGVILLIVGIVVLWIMNPWGFGHAALEFLKGAIVWVVILGGLLLLILGISDLRG